MKGIVISKRVLNIVITLALIGLSSCGVSEADSITRVLNKCAKISTESSRYNTDVTAQATFIADSFQNINVSACPPDFRLAYQAHITAWRNASFAYANNTVGNAMIEGFVAGLTNDQRYFAQSQGNAAYATQQINETYYVLTQVAAAYGARIPVSVVGR